MVWVGQGGWGSAWDRSQTTPHCSSHVCSKHAQTHYAATVTEEGDENGGGTEAIVGTWVQCKMKTRRKQTRRKKGNAGSVFCHHWWHDAVIRMDRVDSSSVHHAVCVCVCICVLS